MTTTESLFVYSLSSHSMPMKMCFPQEPKFWTFYSLMYCYPKTAPGIQKALDKMFVE